MATEIERKFLVRLDLWSPGGVTGVRYRQGYLSTDPDRVVRVRIAGDAAFLTVKGATEDVTRPEFEYTIPLDDAEFMLKRLCLQPVISKVRYRKPWQGMVWEVDVFEGENAGLIIAELELPSSEASFDRPPWVGAEVSLERRYSNAALVAHPWREWGERS